MTEDPDLRRLERESFRSTYDDGLADLVVGLYLAVLGLTMATDLDLLPAVLFALVWPSWLLVRKHLTGPRVGRVRFTQARVQLERTKRRALAIVTALTLVGGLVAFALASGPGASDTLRGWGPVPFGLMLALGMGCIGTLYGMTRFVPYGALLLLAFALPHARGAEPDAWVAAVGLMVVLLGARRLVRFLRANPRPREAADLGAR